MYRPPPGNFSPTAYGGSPTTAVRPNMTWQRPTATNVWKEHTTPEGRKYWYNNVTRQSTWEKPDDLLSPEEKVLKNSVWKEYVTPEGKKYYSNSQTKQTVWDMPPDLKEQIEKAKKEAAEKMAPPPPVIRPALQTPSLASQYIQPIVPEFGTRAEAEKAFIGLLEETGVRPDWTWEQTMRAIITNPLYRALKTTVERKAAFQTWADAEAKREREEREQKEAKQKKNFMDLLKQHKSVIKPYSRYRTIAQILEDFAAFKAIESERQREIYFEEYVQAIQRAEKDRLRELRKQSMEKFNQLLRSIPEITFKTCWKEAQMLYQERQAELGMSLEGMDMLDFLSTFEEYNKQLWEKPLEELNQRIALRRRKERKARDGFKALLKELVEQKKLNIRTLWKEIHPIIKDDPRYLAMVGLADCTPLDLYWDLIEDLDEQLYQQKKTVYGALKKAEFEVDVDTSYEAYLKVLEGVELSEENLKFIFEHLQNKAAQRLKEEKRRQEKKLRKKLDMFRHVLKHMHITLEDSWDTVKSRVENTNEYKSIEDEQLLIDVFEKFMKRLKEKKDGQEEDEEEEEEGMIKEDEDDEEAEYRKRKSHRKDYDDADIDYRMKKKRKDYSSTEEGEALDDYQNDPRRLK